MNEHNRRWDDLFLGNKKVNSKKVHSKKCSFEEEEKAEYVTKEE